MNREEYLSILKRSKFDFVILVTILMLMASNQLLAVNPHRVSGLIEVANGAPIPQDSNYTISRESNPSVTSAIIMNYTLEDDYTIANEIGFGFSLVTDNVSRFVVNVTLQSTMNNTDVDIKIQFWGYYSSIPVVAGTTPTTFSIEPNMSLVSSHPTYWTPYFTIKFITDIELEFRNVLFWAEFETPVSPVILNWQSTDGEPLFVNPYTKWMPWYNPELRIRRENGDSYGILDAWFQNRTLYLKPQNYTMEATWGNEIPSIPPFNISIYENYTTICTLRMKAVKMTFSINQNIPLIHLEIYTYHWVQSFWDSSRIYDLHVQGPEFPEFLFLPPSGAGFGISFSSIDPLSRHLLYSDDVDVFAHEYFQGNSTHHLNAEIWMSYWYILDFIITPQEFVRLSLTIVLFSFVFIRIRIYIKQKKPESTWRNTRFLPAIVLGLTAFIPWYSSAREATYGFYTSIHVVSFGPFPLIASWTDSGGILLDIPQSGFYWAMLSVSFFWLPLLFSAYSMTRPRTNEEESFLSLFFPLLVMGSIGVGLVELYTFPFELNLLIGYLLLIIPAVSFFCHFAIRMSSSWRKLVET